MKVRYRYKSKEIYLKMNRKSIQILRGSENYDPQKSSEKLLDGQPFYSKFNKQLYIGDGITPLNTLSPIASLTNNIADNGATQINFGNATLKVGNTAVTLRKSLSIGSSDVNKTFIYAGYRTPEDPLTRDAALQATFQPIYNAVPLFDSNLNLKTSYPKAQNDAVNLSYLLKPFTSQDDGKLYGIPRIHYKHKVMMQLLFNDQSDTNGVYGPQAIVVAGNYLSDTIEGYNAGIDPTIYGKDEVSGGYTIPDFATFSNAYLNIQNAFLHITGRGFNVEYCYVGSFNTDGEKNIMAPITSYYVGGSNESNPYSSHTMWFHCPTWGITNNKLNNVQLNLYDSPYTGIITYIMDNCSVVPYEKLS